MTTEPLHPKHAYQLHRTDAPETSRLAAAKAAPVLNDRQQLVLDWFRTNGPATSEQMERALAHRYGPNTTRPRISELAEAGLLAWHDYGTTSTGSKARLWEATPQQPTLQPLFPL